MKVVFMVFIQMIVYAGLMFLTGVGLCALVIYGIKAINHIVGRELIVWEDD